MALFQKNVLARYIAAMDAQQIDAAYTQFVAYFHNTERQQNILTSKEEQFQEGFLRELFVKILGYTLNPDPAYNLITEKKDVNDSKKADGAILLNDEVIGIIELKDHKTPDLSKVERQAFGYKNQHPKAKYVVISNFQKLRFYIDNAVEHVEWNLFSLTRDEFAELWLCLQYDNISRHLPATVKSESLSREEQITNKLYKDYIDFKRVLFEDILHRNTTDEGEHSTADWKILLFKKTQKLLDRLLFIFFAEDRNLLPPNSMREIIKQWRQLIELDEDVRLYSRIKKYFGYMNEGHKGKQYDIFAYNGGLFKPDEVLDNLDIDDNLLAEHTLRLSEYDYASEVDVNILGHIFENSLSEIEEVTAQLQNGEAPTVSKRKKDGVFYTPQYITRYIVDNTLGKLCREKREAIGLVEEDYYDAQTRQLKTKQRMLALLTEYRNWLLSLTICDPACGSGAFLNAALQFLIDEHMSLDKMEAALTNSDIEFPNIENSILENNLYGVDINEESVEIARLALWLRTAKPFRKLTTLNGNIKCGNSLISDPAIAGDKAFDWQQEFPQVFEKGGFDIVIGNPPYVKEYTSRSAFEGLHNHPCYQGKMDLWYFFGNLAIEISKKEIGLIGFIAPSNWITNAGASIFRNIIIEHAKILQYIDFGDFKVFEDAGIQTMIYIMQHTQNNLRYNIPYSRILDSNVDSNDVSDFLNKVVSPKFVYFESILEKEKVKDNYIKFINNGVDRLLSKIQQHPHFYLEDKEVGQGIVGAPDDCFLVDSLSGFNENEIQYIKPYFTGLPDRYATYPVKKYIIYLSAHNFLNHKLEDYPNLFLHFEPNRQILSDAKVKYGTPDKPYYYLHRERLEDFFKAGSPKIISQGRCSYPRFYYTEQDYYASRALFSIKTAKVNLKFLLSFLNSSLCRFWLFNKGKMQGICFQVDKDPITSIPIPSILEDDQQPFIELADRMLALNKELQQKRARFLRRLSDNFAELKITATLENFDALTFADFVKELGKQKIRLSLVQQDEWEEYFNQYAVDCQTLTQTIQATDTQIDELVYSLYNLTDSEKSLIRHS